jgi:hypothetical protein
MNRESWLEEREKLHSIMDDIARGYIRLARDQDEYLQSLKRRIAHLDSKLERTD